MKQTAVEWVLKRLTEAYTSDEWKAIIKQAKEMEKQQIFDAFVECWKENMPEGYECKQSAENYYNKTFKSE